MQQHSDFGTHYNYLQNPNDLHPNSLISTIASAPPIPLNDSSSDYYMLSSPYPPHYSQNPDSLNSLPPIAPSYGQSSNPSSFNAFSPVQEPYYDPPYHKNSSFSAPYSSSSALPFYENPYESSIKFDHKGGYPDESSSRYGSLGVHGPVPSDLVSNFHEKKPESGILYDKGQGVYPYDAGKVEPYRDSGAGSSSSNLFAFDDYGRSTSISSGKNQVNSGKIVRAIPKEETNQDVKNGVQKFRVKLLAEGGSQSTMDVLFQIGLDGIHMLDVNTSRILRIYPLETLTKWEATSASIFTFWSKSSIDFEPRRIRLQSNNYTTNTILDTVTAATVQFKEMGGKDSFRSKPSDFGKLSDQPAEKKKGFADWMNLIKPVNEEKDHWVPDEAATSCTACRTDFGAFLRKHHCRNCGDIFCDKCTQGRIALTTDESDQPVRVCDRCMAEVAQRLCNAKELASKPAALHSHDDLARKLQEEMDRNRKVSSGSKSSGGSGKRMREVACPTCTVHLQVQVPSSGSDTIECGVCQNPFLVSAH